MAIKVSVIYSPDGSYGAVYCDEKLAFPSLSLDQIDKYLWFKSYPDFILEEYDSTGDVLKNTLPVNLSDLGSITLITS